MKIFHAFFIFFLLVLWGCKDNSPERFNVSELLNKQHFNGILIGDSLAHITSLLNDSLFLTDDEVRFSEHIKDGYLNYYQAYVIFDNESAYEITVDFYLESDSLVKGFFMDCKQSLDENYGVSAMDEGYAHWATGSINEKVIEIELFNEFLDSEIPAVSLQFFEDFDKQFYAE